MALTRRSTPPYDLARSLQLRRCKPSYVVLAFFFGMYFSITIVFFFSITLTCVAVATTAISNGRHPSSRGSDSKDLVGLLCSPALRSMQASCRCGCKTVRPFASLFVVSACAHRSLVCVVSWTNARSQTCARRASSSMATRIASTRKRVRIEIFLLVKSLAYLTWKLQCTLLQI